jgi:hypothetical protein
MNIPSHKSTSKWVSSFGIQIGIFFIIIIKNIICMCFRDKEICLSINILRKSNQWPYDLANIL